MKSASQLFAIVTLACRLSLSATFAATSAEPQDIAFTAKADGSEQRYVELLPPGFKAAEPHDVLLAFHGHGSTAGRSFVTRAASARGRATWRRGSA